VIALTLMSFLGQAGIFAAAEESDSIRVIGHQRWWEIEYEAAQLNQRFVTANGIHIALGTPTGSPSTSRT